MIEKAFPHFPKELQEAIVQKTIQRSYKTGQMLVRKDSPITGVMIITEGCVKVAQQDDDGSEFVIAYLKAGDSYGVSFSEDTPAINKISIVSITAIEPTEILQMSYADKDAMAKIYDSWYKYILHTAVMYYRLYRELIDSIVFQKMDTRIEFFLRRLSQVKKTNVLQITHQEIADGLNSSREVISRLLKKMEECGKIKTAPNTIKIIASL